VTDTEQTLHNAAAQETVVQPPAAEPHKEPPADTTDADASATGAIRVSVEGIAYLVLALGVLFAFTLRLGIVPLTENEVPRALAAWSAVAPDAAFPATPDSAILQLAQISAMSLLGAGEISARFVTALGAFVLVFSPLLFRARLGAARTFTAVLMLAASPVVIASGRLGSPVIWEALGGVLALWALARYGEHGRTADAVLATVFLTGTALLAGTTGHVLALTLLLALPLAERFAPPNMDTPSVASHLREWPWLPALGLSALTVVVLSTLFMAYPEGLNAVGVAFGQGLAGWARPIPDAPAFYAPAASLLYEPILWIFGIAAVVNITRQDEITPTDRFLIAWLLVAAIASVIYMGTSAANALWLTLPLVGLASGEAVRLLQDEDGMLWFNEADRQSNLFGLSVPGWARWVVAGGMATVLLLMLMHIGDLARQLQTVNSMAFNDPAMSQLIPTALTLAILALMVVFIGFTAASIWGTTATVRGGAVGVLAVGLVAMLGTGWQVAVNRADDPREFWYTHAYGEDVFLLRETLLDIADRETGGFNQLPVTVIADGETIAEDGMLAWVLRDFENATFQPLPEDARAQEIVIIELTEEQPPLGGSYLGQSFTLSRTWDATSLTAKELPAWWFQRSTRVPPSPGQAVALWLRQDVYEGVDVPGLQ